MTEMNGTEPKPTLGFQVDRAISTSISTDGTTAALKLATPSGETFLLTMPVAFLATVRTMCAEALDTAHQRGWYKPPGNVPLRYLGDWSQVMNIRRARGYGVGHADSLRGTVAFTFDPGAPDEATYIMHDAEALAYAAAIRKDVLDRMPPGERAKALAGVQSGGRLILPGRG